MKVLGMSKNSCLFKAISIIVGEKALLGVLGYVQPRPDTRVRQDLVSGAYHSSCAFSVTRSLGLPSREAQNCLREGNLKGLRGMSSWKDLP